MTLRSTTFSVDLAHPCPLPPSLPFAAHTRSRRRRARGGVARGGRDLGRALLGSRESPRARRRRSRCSRGGRRSRWSAHAPRPPCGRSRTTHRRSTRRTRSDRASPRPPRRARARPSPPRDARPREPSTPRPPRPSRRHRAREPTRRAPLGARVCFVDSRRPRVRAPAPPFPHPFARPTPSPSLLPPAPHDLRHVLSRRRQRARACAPRDALRRVRDRPTLARPSSRPRRPVARRVIVAPRRRRTSSIAQTEGPPAPGMSDTVLPHPERAPVSRLRQVKAEGGAGSSGRRRGAGSAPQVPPTTSCSPSTRTRDERWRSLGRRLRPARGGDTQTIAMMQDASRSSSSSALTTGPARSTSGRAEASSPRTARRRSRSLTRRRA